jgi:hypothetical protein
MQEVSESNPAHAGSENAQYLRIERAITAGALFGEVALATNSAYFSTVTTKGMQTLVD